MSLSKKIRLIAAIAASSCAGLIMAFGCGGGTGAGGDAGSPSAGGGTLAAPAGLSASAGDAQITLNWNAVDGATGYAVYWSTAAGISAAISESDTPPAKADSTTAFYSHTGLTNGTAYYYAVVATNADGEGELSDEVSATPVSGLPGALLGLAITAGNKELALNWNAVDGATGYKVYWNTTAGVDANAPNVETATSNSFAHTDLSNLSTYYYKVAAVNAAGEGALSEEKLATPAFGSDELQDIEYSPAVVDDEFGYAVAIDGDTAIVGAPHYNLNKGTAFIYRYANSTWTKEAELAPPGALTTNGTYGKAVAVSGDYAIVGNPTGNGDNANSGVAVVFRRTGTSWAQDTLLKETGGASGDMFGRSVAISADYTAVGAPEDDNANGADAGAIFYWQTTNLGAAPSKVKGGAAGDQYGSSLAINGNSMAVGAPYYDAGPNNDAGIIYFITFNPLSSTQHTADNGAANDWFGASVAIDGTVAMAGSPSNGTKAGSAVIIRYSNGAWAEEKVLTPSSGSVNDQFGASVSISGNYALAGAYLNDAAFVYKYSGSAWAEEERLIGSDTANGDRFGFSVGIDSDLIVIGAYLADHSGTADAGAVYFY